MTTEIEHYDKRVEELDGDCFHAAASAMAAAITLGEGVRIWFQPGDATRYRIEVGVRRTLTIGNGDPTTMSMERTADTRITFGTEGELVTEYLGHSDRMNCGHPWTNAVWRRIRSSLAAQLPREEW